MGKALLIVVALVLLVYTFFDLFATDRRAVRNLPKWLWFFVVVLIPVVGPLLWLFFGSAQSQRPPHPRPQPGGFGPDDDPDFLRGL